MSSVTRVYDLRLLCCTQRNYAMRELKSVADACKCVNASQMCYSASPGNKIRSGKGLLALRVTRERIEALRWFDSALRWIDPFLLWLQPVAEL